MLLTTDAVGGVWRYSVDLAAGMAPRPVLVVLGPSPSAAQCDEAARLGLTLIDTGLPLDWTAADPAALAAVTTALRDIAAGQEVRSVHLHAPALAGPAPWPVPVVAVAHSCVATWWHAVRSGPLPEDLAWRADATRRGLQTADAIIAPTGAHANATCRAYGELSITTVHNGARLPLSLAGEGRGEGGTPRTILTAGRLWDDAKNVAALDRIARDLHIRAAGPTTGPNGARIDLPNLHLLGTLDAPGMRRAYADASVFASLAIYEPFGLSVLEAAQCGLRLVLSDIASFRELWDGAAHFVPLGADPRPALDAALADTGDARARAALYTVDKMVAGTLAVHRRLGVQI